MVHHCIKAFRLLAIETFVIVLPSVLLIALVFLLYSPTDGYCLGL